MSAYAGSSKNLKDLKDLCGVKSDTIANKGLLVNVITVEHDAFVC